MVKKEIALSSEIEVLKKYWKVETSYNDVVNGLLAHASVCDSNVESRN